MSGAPLPYLTPQQYLERQRLQRAEQLLHFTSRSIAEIAAEVGFHGRILWDPTKPNGQPRRCLDISRIKQTIGFQPTHSLRDGLKKTIRWYRANLDALRELRL